ncbi:rhomboid family intramembrane serine protease [soil metagenome]
MFPISDSIKAARFPFLNLLIIAANAYVFYLQLTSPNLDSFITQYALIPSHIDFTHLVTLLPFVTAMFLHGGFMHIISNMWFLKVFGDNVEGHMNPLLFLLLYFGSGILGNVLQYLLMPSSSIPMLGASGAVAGILGAYFILFPQSKVKTFVPIFFLFTIISIPAVFMLGYWFILQIFSGVGSLGNTSGQGGVAFWAHIGGFVFGLLFAKYLEIRTHKSSADIIDGEIIG